MSSDGHRHRDDSTGVGDPPRTAGQGGGGANVDGGPGAGGRRAGLRRALRRGLVAAVVVFGLLQLVPYGWSHPNPPVTAEAPWPDEESAAIARESCYACHSNETDWPPYSYVAPFSWLVRSDVEGGRDELNFSTWDRDAGEADDAIEAILVGSMPLDQYTLVHRGARLSDAEADRLVAALRQMDAGNTDVGGADDGGRADDGDRADDDRSGDDDRADDSSGPGSG